MSTSSTNKTQLLLILNPSTIYTPAPLQPSENTSSILLAGTKIVALLNHQQATELEALFGNSNSPTQSKGGLLRVIDGTNTVAVPGFVDIHVHITGGGGENGFASRTHEASAQELLSSGITTVIGTLGTDTVTRTPHTLLGKSRALTEQGVTCYTWAGGYRYPTRLITSDVQEELVVVDTCIGVGEVAISDHRGSNVSGGELARLASEARVGGMLSGKAGIVHCHMGTGKRKLDPLYEAIHCSDVPITQFLPTHMERSEELITEGYTWLKKGGMVDLTCQDVEAVRNAYEYYLEKIHQEGISVEETKSIMDRVSVSTDAYGSMPLFDPSTGELIKYDVAKPDAMIKFLQYMVLQQGYSIDSIIPLMTSNPATALKLSTKGRIAVGCDADIVLLDKETLDVECVITQGIVQYSKSDYS